VTTFLLEIGTEELPADFSQQVIEQLQEKVLADFEHSRLKYGHIQCSVTPRRIVLFIKDLADIADDFIEERKGPPCIQAFKNGVPTSAAIGFAKRCGLGTEELVIRETSKGPFVFAEIREKGKPAIELLTELIPQWIGYFQGRRFMRWGSGEQKFSRPIRWIVSLLDNHLVPIKIQDCDPEIISGNKSRGHRLFSDSLVITSANDYFLEIENAGILVDREKRKNFIKKLVNEYKDKDDVYPELSLSLLNELTDLVESPSLIHGSFDKSFLSLPPEVLTTVMKSHQRYIPLYLSEKLIDDPLSLDSKSTLASSFLFISNGLKTATETIRKGNERVLKARLSDAKFFVETDLSVSSSHRRKLLDEVSFSEGLGSLLDRVIRIEWIVNIIAKRITTKEFNIDNLKRAAYFCKHDLVSQMVGEFPELEGIIGGKYLIKEGEHKEVALAVLEHYFPRSSKDSLPSSAAGSVLALSERFELLLSIFSKGERPSGSSDPYALRRAGNGILQILWSKNWHFDVKDFIDLSVNYWAEILPHFNINSNDLVHDLYEFFRQRIISLLEEEGIDFDLIQAVVGNTISIPNFLSDPVEIRFRIDLLSDMREKHKLSSVQTVVTRASRLAEKSSLPLTILSSDNVVKSELFEKASEFAILKLIKDLEPIVNGVSANKYVDLANGLAAGSKALSEFFDGENSVMVMVDDEAVRTNRLNLLAVLRNQSSVLADFSQISG
tara:strand:+ start:36984 stop:39152 length:2169 start_codon:yes stop_codon:yes gene_type:complete